jgi:hypothetical protein
MVRCPGKWEPDSPKCPESSARRQPGLDLRLNLIEDAEDQRLFWFCQIAQAAHLGHDGGGRGGGADASRYPCGAGSGPWTDRGAPAQG